MNRAPQTRDRSKMNSTETRFLRIKSKTRLDGIRNEVYRDELKVESIEVTIQRGQLRWLGHVTRMGEERLAKKVHEVKEGGKRKWEDQEILGWKK